MQPHTNRVQVVASPCCPAVYGPSVYLQTLHWGGRALQTAVEESGDLTNLRPFVEVVRMLVE